MPCDETCGNCDAMLCDGCVCADNVNDASPGRKRARLDVLEGRRNNASVLGAYLSEQGLQSIFAAYSNLYEYAAWSFLTHLLFTGLSLANGVVSIIGNHSVWLPLLNSVRQRNPSMKLMLTLPQLHCMKGLAEELAMDKFWESLAAVVETVKADGVVITLETTKDIPDMQKFVDAAEKFKIWVVLSNRTDFHGASTIEAVCSSPAIDRVIVNSFGFMKDKTFIRVHDTMIADFERVAPDTPKICMGVDTCGIVFHPVAKKDPQILISIMPLHEIERIKFTGVQVKNEYVKPIDMKCKYRQDMGCLMHAKKMTISFDNNESLRDKVKYIEKKNYSGIVLGFLEYDMHPVKTESLVNTAFVNLAASGRDSSISRFCL